jgi:hypothetical protein
VIAPITYLEVIGIAEPKNVDGLRLVVDPQPRSQRGEMGLRRSSADPQGRGRCGMATALHVRAKDLELAIGGKRGT